MRDPFPPRGLRQGRKDADGKHRAWNWLDGLLALGPALALLLLPALPLFVPVLTAGAIAVATGASRIVSAVRAADVLPGVATPASGALLLARPGPGPIASVWIVALEAIAMGILPVAPGVRPGRLSLAAAPH